ncbi:hypothetical protein EDF58_1299 [Novosphingobium sp. PhB57]|nr:hypothetical protein EDF58_1299 [Novosphingobium sp. PhB57]
MTRSEILAPSGETRVSMMFGVQKMNLRPIAITQETWFTGRAPCPGSDDLCFLTDTAPDDVTKHLIHCEVAIELGPVAKSGALGPIRSVYVRDPDGNLVEISSYA